MTACTRRAGARWQARRHARRGAPTVVLDDGEVEAVLVHGDACVQQHGAQQALVVVDAVLVVVRTLAVLKADAASARAPARVGR